MLESSFNDLCVYVVELFPNTDLTSDAMLSVWRDKLIRHDFGDVKCVLAELRAATRYQSVTLEEVLRELHRRRRAIEAEANKGKAFRHIDVIRKWARDEGKLRREYGDKELAVRWARAFYVTHFDRARMPLAGSRLEAELVAILQKECGVHDPDELNGWLQGVQIVSLPEFESWIDAAVRGECAMEAA